MEPKILDRLSARTFRLSVGEHSVSIFIPS